MDFSLTMIPVLNGPRQSAQSTALMLVHAGLRRYHFHEPSAWGGIISHYNSISAENWRAHPSHRLTTRSRSPPLAPSLPSSASLLYYYNSLMGGILAEKFLRPFNFFPHEGENRARTHVRLRACTRLGATFLRGR